MVLIKETLDASIIETESGEIRLNQYQIHDVIGSGSFGTVSLAIDVDTNKKYAIKEFSKSRLRKKNQSNLLRGVGRSASRGRGGMFNIRAARIKAGQSDNPMDLIKGELAVLKKLDHPNVVKLFEVLDNPNDDMLYMVFEICEKGPILNVSITEKFKFLSEEESKKLFRQILLGVEYLHENGIAHRDIKPDNLLVSNDGIIKIVDFGVSEMFDKQNDTIKSTAGSPAFMAPELGRETTTGLSLQAADIWAMGVTLFAMVFGFLPFQGENIIDLKENIQSKPVVIPDSCPDDLKDLLEKLLDKDPNTRIHINEMRVHPWITSNGKDPLPSIDENCQKLVLEITDQDVHSAIRQYGAVFKVVHAVYKFKQLRAKSKSRDRSNESSPANSPSDSELKLPIIDIPQVSSPLSTAIDLQEEPESEKK